MEVGDHMMGEKTEHDHSQDRRVMVNARNLTEKRERAIPVGCWIRVPTPEKSEEGGRGVDEEGGKKNGTERETM